MDEIQRGRVVLPPFLAAEWRLLVMLNFEVDRALLEPLVPRGTELDPFSGSILASVVAFRFLRTRLLGVPLLFHGDFDEVNLRFYVRRKAAEGWRHGVVFVRELVAREMISIAARTLYNEPYLTVPIRHELDMAPAFAGRPGRASYSWRAEDGWCSVTANTTGAPFEPDESSENRFLTARHWGYTSQRDGGTIEYQVQHPPWRVWNAKGNLPGRAAFASYAPRLADSLAAAPRSVLVAEGSRVSVSAGRRIA
jgi:uncharacterized protein YqjF (DUF2071 family)